MKLFLLPISTRRALVYCQKVTQKPAAELGYIDKATKKAADTWAKWEAAESGWQKRLTLYGNRALQRIPYQEWGLKSFPPSNSKIEAEELANNQKFPVYYPGNVMRHEDVPRVMARLAKERKQLHWKRFTWSLIGIPFSIPFGLIPILPNIPFFYLSFRAWSHWRALKGSDHLDFILDNRLFRAMSTSETEDIYRNTAPHLLKSYSFVTPSQIAERSEPEEQLLLTSSSHTLVARSLGVPELSGEIERAVWQVQRQLEKDKSDVAQNDQKAEQTNVKRSDEDLKR